MFRLTILFLSCYLILFLLRVILNGGLNPEFRDDEFTFFSAWRGDLAKLVDTLLPYPESTMLSGIVLGEDKLPFWLKKELRETSTIHIMVVSGQNLSMLAGFLFGLVYLLGRRVTIFLSLGLLIVYSLFTGFQIPVIRALVMIFFAYLSQIIGREQKPLWSLTLTAGGLLLFNPNWIFSLSFQLSFIATLGVILSRSLHPVLKFIPKIMREDIAVTLSTTIFVLPIIAYNFGNISLVGILVNILILWSIPLVMIFGIAAILAGLLNLILGKIVGLAAGVLLTYCILIIKFFASLPIASISLEQTSIFIWIGYYLILGSVFWILKMQEAVVQKSKENLS